ncbi:retinoic acid receptor responder protein 1 isoform X1 [Cricetulus griseus]|uniref:retinoic acid receptor responder protein 1 isoform X1 n=1 Tax=Cricetulus griseus TaxID=10029 RepID=UPI0004540EE8|nr:retinoic acid receptor responder protein 1 isoform X1 [Cricetulus griseus]
MVEELGLPCTNCSTQKSGPHTLAEQHSRDDPGDVSELPPPPGHENSTTGSALAACCIRASRGNAGEITLVVDPQEGCEVNLVFSTERYNPEEEDEEHLGKCSARVFFKNQKPKPAINVTCMGLTEKMKRQARDYLLYKQLKQLKNPLDVIRIPDSHGQIDPSLRPLWDLAFLGSSYVMWEKTTQFLNYYLIQISSVKQLKTNDDGIDFDFTVLLHEFSTQEIIPCRIHLFWYPGKPLKVQYHCQELQSPEEASGTDEASAMAPTELSNF